MRQIVRMRFGSHLYGTATPLSDTDIKGVYVPTAREILLGRAKKVVHHSTKTDVGAKNTAADVDEEFYSLAEFMKLCLEGQTVAIDMLFAPSRFYIDRPTDEWGYVQRTRQRLLSRNLTAFVGYCRHQAAKYGIKGSRVAAARLAFNMLSALPDHDKLGPHIADMTGGEFIVSEERNGLLHLNVCGRLFPATATVKWSRDVMAKIVAEYGQRALAAEKNEGIDWKALSHAVRVAYEVNELLTTARVTFPRPEAHLLVSIKLGQYSYAAVAEMIEEQMSVVEANAARSSLPEHGDVELAETIIMTSYRSAVCNAH